MGSANPKSIEALSVAAKEEDKITVAAVVKQSFEGHNRQRYLASALPCNGSALVTVKNTEVNSGLEAWRGLNATCMTATTKSPASTDAVFFTSETCRVGPADD